MNLWMKMYYFCNEEKFQEILNSNMKIIPKNDESIIVYDNEEHFHRKKGAENRKYRIEVSCIDTEEISLGCYRYIDTKPIECQKIWEYSCYRYKIYKSKMTPEESRAEDIEHSKSVEFSVWGIKKWNKYFSIEYNCWIGYWNCGKYMGHTEDGRTYNDARFEIGERRAKIREEFWKEMIEMAKGSKNIL